MGDTTLANQMVNFFMNKIHKIDDALECYDKFKPVERNMDNTLESFRELVIEEIEKLIKRTKLTTCHNHPNTILIHKKTYTSWPQQ